MKRIGINSRLVQGKETGIPKYIKRLYQAIQFLDESNKYLFFQTKKTKKVGATKLLNLPQVLFFDVIFDLFLVHFLIVKEKIDIFHSPSHVLPLFRRKSCKYLVTIHDLSFLIFPNQNNALFNIYYNFIVKRSALTADHILADSINTKKDIIKYYKVDQKKISVLYPGVDGSFMLQKKNQFKMKNPYIFSVATHPKRKNLPALLKAFANLNSKLPKYKLILCGAINIQHRNELLKLARKLRIDKYVEILGFIDDDSKFIKLYQNSSLFIYPTLYEGFGLPVLEAMASGCVVIASNTSSVPEILSDKKFLFDPSNSNDLLCKMHFSLNLTSQEKRKVIKNNYQIAKKFSWNSSSRSFIKHIL